MALKVGKGLGKGWRNESHRHSLASKGIKTVTYLPKKRYAPVKKGNTTISNENGLTRVTLYHTDVVTFDDKEIILDTGGYETLTTKDRMNSTSEKYGLGYRIFQKDYAWYVDYKGKTIPFDSMVVKLKR